MTRTSIKRLIWALALSLLVHLILTFGPDLSPPEPHPDKIFEASLESLPKSPPRPPPSARKAINKSIKPAPRHPPAPVPDIPDTAPDPEPSASSAPVEAAATEATQEISIPLPELAEIRYTLYKGQDGFPAGKAEHTWNREGTHYTITHIAEASGIVSLFYSGRHVQISQGEITANGMQPESYKVQRGQGADKTDLASFDWQAKQLTFGSGDDTRTVHLPDGTQDLLSFLYQLAFAVPEAGSSTALHITNGRKLDNYGYQALEEEMLDTRLGPIKALHIEKHHLDGEENTEVWLATEYHYLPVKIRHTDKHGSVVEQTATAINIK